MYESTAGQFKITFTLYPITNDKLTQLSNEKGGPSQPDDCRRSCEASRPNNAPDLEFANSENLNSLLNISLPEDDALVVGALPCQEESFALVISLVPVCSTPALPHPYV